MSNITFVISRPIYPPEKGDSRLCVFRSLELINAKYNVTIIQIIPSLFTEELKSANNGPFSKTTKVYTLKVSYVLIALSFLRILFFRPDLPLQSSHCASNFVRSQLKSHFIAAKPDVVHFLTARTSPLWDIVDDIPSVFDFIDSYSYNYSSLLSKKLSYPFGLLSLLLRPFYLLELPRFESLESKYYNCRLDTQRSLYVSARDVQYVKSKTKLQQSSLAGPEIIPIGICPVAHQYPPYQETSNQTYTTHEPFRVLFYGTLSYQPNLDAAKYLIQQILPELYKSSIPVEIIIAGRHAPRELKSLTSRTAAVTLISPVNDMQSLLNSVDAVCAPVRTGSGLQFKVIEPMQHYKPVITSQFCADGFGLAPNEVCFIATTPAEYATYITGLACRTLDPVDMVNRAHQYVQHFTWPQTVTHLCKLYSQLVSGI